MSPGTEPAGKLTPTPVAPLTTAEAPAVNAVGATDCVVSTVAVCEQSSPNWPARHTHSDPLTIPMQVSEHVGP
eukprot:1917986-Rhodomonas_salina.1